MLKNFRNIPNQITLLRILLIPFLVYLSYVKNITVLLVLYGIAGLTDFLDGFIARKFSMTTNFGAKLDNIADDLLGILTIFLLYLVVPGVIEKYLVIIVILVIMVILRAFIIAIKFKNSTRLHLYTGKTAVTLIYVSFFSILLLNYSLVLVITFGVLFIALTEELIILLSQKKINPDIKSVLEFLKI